MVEITAPTGEALVDESTPSPGVTYATATPAYRTYVLWLLLAVYVINFLDRQVINILAEPIKNDLHLADWQVGLLSGFAKINDFGVKVLETGVASPIRISIDESGRTTDPRQQQAQVAPSTPQQQAITEALEKVIVAINEAEASDRDKNEVKSLLRKLLRSKATNSVLGPGAQSLAAKYFAE